MEKRGGEGIGTLSFSMITFHRDGFQVLRKTFLDFKTGKRLGKIESLFPPLPFSP